MGDVLGRGHARRTFASRPDGCVIPAPGRIELGPESLLWQWAGDTRIAFMGATIGLLQLMHPAIGAGVLVGAGVFVGAGVSVGACCSTSA